MSITESTQHTIKLMKDNNLKAIPFSHLNQGDTFYVLDMVELGGRIRHLQRRLVGKRIPFTDGLVNVGLLAEYIDHRYVYVPVWRPTVSVEVTL